MSSSRADAQAITREKILAAAHEEFTSRRFVDVSLDAIAARAGFTKGAIYSNFASKTDVLFSVLERHMSKVGDEYSFATITAADNDLGDAISRRAQKTQDTDLGYFRLMTAVWAEAVHDPDVAKRLAAIRREHREKITNAISERLANMQLDLPVEPVHIATGLIGMSMASLMDATIDSEVDAGKVHKTIIDLVLAGAFATAASPATSPSTSTSDAHHTGQDGSDSSQPDT